MGRPSRLGPAGRLGGPMEAAQMLRTLEPERARGRELFASAGSLEELEAANIAVLGRKSPLGEGQRALGAPAAGQRRELRRAVNEARTGLADACEARRDALSIDVE